MTRQKILFIVAALTILVGFGWIWSFLSPLVDPNQPKILNPVPGIFGTLFLLIGWGLFRRNELALEIGFWAWFTSLIWNTISTMFLLSKISESAIPRNILAVIFMLALLAAHLSAVIFLGQKETQKLCVHHSAQEADIQSN